MKYRFHYCSTSCMNIHRGNLRQRNCKSCGELFIPQKKTSNYCSRACSNRGRRGISYSSNSWGNKSRRNLAVLVNTFHFDSCMVEGCNYNRTYDIHRLIEGKNGGDYVIGNMFAICPNHHAEVTRGLIKLEKIDDQTLRIKEDAAHGRATGFEHQSTAEMS